jgi:large repetitive protein
MVVTQRVPGFACLTLLFAIAASAPIAAALVPASAPTSVRVVPGNGRVAVSWTPVPGAAGYHVYRAANGVWEPAPIASTTATTHTSRGLVNGTTYSFTVAAYAKGVDGPLSLAVTAMPLSPPQEVTAASGDERVTITWQLSVGATSYTIYRKQEGELDFAELTTGVTAPPFVDPRLENGARYSYYLRAATASTDSDPSAVVSVRLKK